MGIKNPLHQTPDSVSEANHIHFRGRIEQISHIIARLGNQIPIRISRPSRDKKPNHIIALHVERVSHHRRNLPSDRGVPAASSPVTSEQWPYHSSKPSYEACSDIEDVQRHHRPSQQKKPITPAQDRGAQTHHRLRKRQLTSPH